MSVIFNIQVVFTVVVTRCTWTFRSLGVCIVVCWTQNNYPVFLSFIYKSMVWVFELRKYTHCTVWRVTLLTILFVDLSYGFFFCQFHVISVSRHVPFPSFLFSVCFFIKALLYYTRIRLDMLLNIISNQDEMRENVSKRNWLDISVTSHQLLTDLTIRPTVNLKMAAH